MLVPSFWPPILIKEAKLSFKYIKLPTHWGREFYTLVDVSIIMFESRRYRRKPVLTMPSRVIR